MDWSNERYVRLYTRDTVDWEMLPWESRALFPMLLRKVDRAGVLEMGRHGEHGLAIALKVPAEVVSAGLAGLLEDGCIVVQGSSLVMRNFIEAQECPQSDAARKRAERERSRARAMASEVGQTVTKRDQESRAVTPSHTESLCADPICAEPNQDKEEIASSPPPAAEGDGHPIELALVEPKEPDQVRRAFDHWLERRSQLHGKRASGTKLTTDRRRKISARLREYGLEDVLHAIDGMLASQWHVDNDQTDIELACRSGSKLERFRDQWLASRPPEPLRLVPKEPEPVYAPPPPEFLAEMKAALNGVRSPTARAIDGES
jgi:hypothetical protein